MEKRDIGTIDELYAFAHEIVNGLALKNNAHVLALQGDLGAGKTAFVKEIGKVLTIEETITSPTFVIMKSYPIKSHPFFKTLTHIDAYRIESDDEMRVLGFEELLKDPTRLVCIEWPEKIERLIPEDAYPISFTLHEQTRTVTYGT